MISINFSSLFFILPHLIDIIILPRCSLDTFHRKVKGDTQEWHGMFTFPSTELIAFILLSNCFQSIIYDFKVHWLKHVMPLYRYSNSVAENHSESQDRLKQTGSSPALAAHWWWGKVFSMPEHGLGSRELCLCQGQALVSFTRARQLGATPALWLGRSSSGTSITRICLVPAQSQILNAWPQSRWG